jgi:hypothetical protein
MSKREQLYDLSQFEVKKAGNREGIPPVLPAEKETP